MTELIDFPRPKADAEDVARILAVASLHYLYGKHEAALNIVSVVEYLSPDNRTAIELKIALLAECREFAAVLHAYDQANRLYRDLPEELKECRKLAQSALRRT